MIEDNATPIVTKATKPTNNNEMLSHKAPSLQIVFIAF
jgi:hypothetical protein